MAYKVKAYYLLIGFFCFTMYNGFSQDQKVADSAKRIYREDTAKGIAKLKLLKTLSFNEVHDLKLALQYAEELITLSKQYGNSHYLYSGYLQKGNKFNCRIFVLITLELLAYRNRSYRRYFS